MPRPIEEPIPPGESLYRGLKPDHIDGPRVLAEAIDMQGTSTVREKYGTAMDAMSSARGETHVGVITPQELPPPIQVDESAWEWFAVDDPLDGNESHAELRTRQTSERTSRDHKRAKGLKREQLRIALANRFRVLGSD